MQTQGFKYQTTMRLAFIEAGYKKRTRVGILSSKGWRVLRGKHSKRND